MASSTNKSTISWVRTLLRPVSELKRVLQEGSGISSFFFMLLSGFVLLHTLFDLRNLGDQFEIGQIMAYSLIFGPVTGLLFGSLITMFLLNIGCFLDPDHKVIFNQRQFNPGYLFFLLLLWTNWVISIPLAFVLFLGFRYFHLWDKSGLDKIHQAYSSLISRISYYLHFISGGRTAYSRLHSAVGISMIAFALISFLTLIEFRSLEAANFSKEYHTFSGPVPIVFAILFPLIKTGLIVWFIYALAAIQQGAFRLSFSKAIISSLISFGLSLVIIILISNFIIYKSLSDL